MSSNIYTAGLNNVGSYQVSGIPFATGSLDPNDAARPGLRVDFPYVTSWIEITNHSNSELFVGFSSLGVQGTNFFRVIRNNGAKGDPTSHVLHLKVTEIWLSGSSTEVDVVAGLTYIPTAQVTAISPSGSNWSGSSGVG